MLLTYNNANKKQFFKPKLHVCTIYIFLRELKSKLLCLKCSAQCGEGIQSRTVTCHRTNHHGIMDPTPVDNCPMDQKPSSQQTCKLRECDDKYYWTTGQWTKVNLIHSDYIRYKF